ncbi:MAG: hypothetical protein JST68_03815 [Bacteroidetes bacterium]|nr:hypothetical protein [Bacteroidota bacterium]
MEKSKLKAIFGFLVNYEPFENEEKNCNFEEMVDKATGKKNTMGIIEAIAEIRAAEAREIALEEGQKIGLEKANRKTIKNLLERNVFSVKEIAEIVGVTLKFVREVKAEA